MKPKRLMYLPPYSWKTRFLLFLGVFGSCWTITESMLAFGIGTKITLAHGYSAYGGLVLLSVIITFLVERLNKYRVMQKMLFIRLKIILVQDGTTNLIEVPEEMLIREFIKLFICEITKQGSHPMIEKWDLFETTLQVENPVNSGNFKSLSKHKTIKEASLKNDDVCRLFGKIIEPTIILSPDFEKK